MVLPPEPSRHQHLQYQNVRFRDTTIIPKHTATEKNDSRKGFRATTTLGFGGWGRPLSPPQTAKYWWRFDRVDVGKIALRLVADRQTEDKISAAADAAGEIYSRRRHILHHSFRYHDKRSPCIQRERSPASTDSVMAFQSRSEPFIVILMVIKEIESCQYSLTY